MLNREKGNRVEENAHCRYGQTNQNQNVLFFFVFNFLFLCGVLDAFFPNKISCRGLITCLWGRTVIIFSLFFFSFFPLGVQRG